MAGYRSDTTVVCSSAFVAVPHRSQGISVRHDSVDFLCAVDKHDMCVKPEADLRR